MTDPDAEPSDQSSANGSHLRPRGVVLENEKYGTHCCTPRDVASMSQNDPERTFGLSGGACVARLLSIMRNVGLGRPKCGRPDSYRLEGDCGWSILKVVSSGTS